MAAAAGDDTTRTVRALRAVAGMTLDADSRHRLKEIVAVMGKRGLIRNPTPEHLKAALEELGPTFVKLGQMVSSHADVFPAEYCEALASLRNSSSPLSFDEAEELLSQSFDGNYHEVFESIEPIPLGSASIAQVHRAQLKTGERVAVKIQRAGIKGKMLEDIKLMRRAAELLELSEVVTEGFDAGVFIDELERTVKEEIDFRKEAENLREFYLNNEKRFGITSPKVYMEYSNETVLVMEYMDGRSFEQIDVLREGRSDAQMKHLGHRIVENYLTQMLDDGLFHADPHSANILLRDEEVVWIDLGMMGRLAKGECELLRRMFVAIATSDAADLKETLLSWGHATGNIDHARLLRDLDALLARYAMRDIANLDLTNGMNDLLNALRDQHIAMPGSFMTLARSLITLQGTAQTIDPSINIVDTLANYLQKSLIRDFDLPKRTEKIFADICSSADKAARIPRQASDALDMLNKGQLEMNMSLKDLEEPVAALRRSINVATLGIIVAGLFIGSSLLCVTQMEPRVLGVPVIGFCGYACAFALAVYCVYKVLKNEREKRRFRRKNR